MKQINYTENYAKSSFADLIQSFGNWQQDNEIVLDETTGTGKISFINIEEGLQLRMWDCTFNKGLEIFRDAEGDRENRTFTVVYYLTPDSFILEDCQNSPAVINSVWNTVLMSSDAKFKARILAGKPLRCVSFNFSSEWLKKNVLCDISVQKQLLEKFTLTADPFAIFDSLSALERKLTDSLFETCEQNIFGKFFWRSKSLNLLTEFFSKIVSRLSLYSGTDRFHEERMAEVEKQLMLNLHNGLPDIKTLAKQVAISESTLKRYFRRIYGKNIYSYFLEKRMIHAKGLLTEKKKTVTETAVIMGYENISHFSNTFKRFYGLLPGAFRRLNQLNAEG